MKMKMSEIIYNAESQRYEVGGYELHAGDFIRVASRDYDDRIEYDQGGWYLVNGHDYNLDGLVAKLI